MQEITNAYADEYIIRLPFGRIVLEGSLGVPARPGGIVVFPNVGGSVRCDGRLHFLAREMRERGFATLLINLLSVEEEIVDLSGNALRFNIRLLANRLGKISRWLVENALAENGNVCYFAFGTAAAAALTSAARHGPVNSMVVCSARADLAGDTLAAVTCPVLSIVGRNDFSLIDINRDAMLRMHVLRRLAIVRGMERNREKATALRDAGRRACRWFGRHLASAAATRDVVIVSRGSLEIHENELVNI